MGSMQQRPIRTPEALPGRPHRHQTKSILGRDQRRARPLVWLVEDNDLVQASLCAILESAGYPVRCYANGEAALAEFTRVRAPDLLVTDVHLPGFSGLELAKKLTGTCPGLGIVVISGRLRDVAPHANHLPGGVRFLTKPFSAQTLLQCLEQLSAPSR